jgi:transcriptional regulator with XRE-family HTH domain
MTQDELAEAVGVRQGSIGEAERKGHGSRHTAKIAEVCKVRPEWLARGELPMLPQTLSQEMVQAVLPLDQLTGEERENMLNLLKGLRGFAHRASKLKVEDESFSLENQDKHKPL